MKLLLLQLLLILLAAADLVSGFRREHRQHHECLSSHTPVCRSDRFDVVFSHYDDWGCKVFKCKCREPVGKSCPQGQARLQVDSDGCRYYECQSCPPRPVCQGSQTPSFQGNDANGCPVYVCDCPTNPNRPQCGTNQQLQQGTDSSGCPYFFCQQVRAQCPDQPTCSTNQQLIATGRVGDCQIYRCECLTPAKPACSIGSQARLQDDGLGCQVYRCQENRSPCPPEPTCPSAHQMVSQDGIDGNNCIKYVCKCIPLAPVTCPGGYVQLLQTDEACGCQFYKCDPNCQVKPNCPSTYQEAVITGTRNNGCPTYSCQCKNPEVLSCSQPDAHLVLSTATDGSGCDIYVCQVGDSRSCGALPSCPIGQAPTLSSYDSRGCPVYVCSVGGGGGGGGGGTRACPPPPQCGPSELVQAVGRDVNGCTQFVCYTAGCQAPPNCGSQQAVFSRQVGACPVYVCQDSRTCDPVPACPQGQLAFQVGYINGEGSCPQYLCQPSFCPAPAICPASQRPNYVTISNGCVSVTCGNTRSCRGVPTCRSGETPQVSGTDSLGCTRYICYRLGCPSPPACPSQQLVGVSGYDAANCAVYTCQTDTGCQAPVTCLPSETQLYIGQDTAGCPEYLCHRHGCTPPPTCTAGERLVATGVSGSCPIYTCQSAVRSCPVQPTCPAGQTPSVVAYDSSSCPVYSCSGGSIWGGTNSRSGGGLGGVCLNSQVPGTCPAGQTPISSGTDAYGCPVFVCQFSGRACPYPPVCPDGRAAVISGRDANNCPIYGTCYGDVYGRAGGVIIGQTVATTPALTCPRQPECQYQQLRIRSQEALSDGQVCDRYTCIGLGDYSGRPPKCHDNPTYCDVSQTVETYVQHGSHKPCQRVVCKAGDAYDSLFGL